MKNQSKRAIYFHFSEEIMKPAHGISGMQTFAEMLIWTLVYLLSINVIY